MTITANAHPAMAHGYTVADLDTLDTILIILLGCERATDARHVLTHAPRAVTVDRVQIRSSGTGLINEAAEHAPVCTHTATTARTAVAS